MTGPWLLLLLALHCPALRTGVSGVPFPTLAPPVTRLVDGKPHTLLVCLVLDVAPPGLDSPIWFSAGNGSALDAFTYGPSPAADGTWTGLAQLSLPAEELAALEPLACHWGPGPEGRSRSAQPLGLPGWASAARTCSVEPLGGSPSRALRLGTLRLLLCKLLLVDLLLTCGRLALRRPLHPPRRGAPSPSPRGRSPEPEPRAPSPSPEPEPRAPSPEPEPRA